MGIAERDYSQRPPAPPRGPLGRGGGFRTWSVTTWLIIINVAVFLLDNGVFMQPGVYNKVRTETNRGEIRFVDNNDPRWERARVDPRIVPDPNGWDYYKPIYDPSDPAYDIRDARTWLGKERFSYDTPLRSWGHFSTAKGFFGAQVWRLVTFQFLHQNFEHILINMLGLYFLGRGVEQRLGRRRYLAFYLTCGIFGAIAYLVLNTLGFFTGLDLPGLLVDDPYTPLLGASAGVFGVLMATAFYEPKAYLLLFFVIPVRVRTFAYLFTAFAAVRLIMGSSNAGGEAAHLGGALAGFYLIRHNHLLRDFFDVFGNSNLPDRDAGGRSGPLATVRAKREAKLEKEVDRILKKVQEQGLASLTPAERKTMQESSKRLRGNA